MGEYIIKIQDLNVHFEMQKSFVDAIRFRPGKKVKAVDGISLNIKEKEVIGIVGETGCGKSTLAKTLLKVYPITSGKIFFNGFDINDLKRKKLIDYYSKVQMVWQDPWSALNSRMKVGEIISRPLIKLKKKKGDYLKKTIKKVIKTVGLNEDDLNRYPHEFSGGGRQRIVLARALSSEPKVLIADEPTSSLDVSIQAQVLNLLKELKKNLELTVVFISHNLSIINFISDRVVVMFFGRIVEILPKKNLFSKNYHYYTKKLISSVPTGKKKSERQNEDIRETEINYEGCVYYHRCSIAKKKCKEEIPELVEMEDNHLVACFYPNME